MKFPSYNGSNNYTIVPTEQWNSTLSLCPGTHTPWVCITAVDKCGMRSGTVHVDLKWDDEGQSKILD